MIENFMNGTINPKQTDKQTNNSTYQPINQLTNQQKKQTNQQTNTSTNKRRISHVTTTENMNVSKQICTCRHLDNLI